MCVVVAVVFCFWGGRAELLLYLMGMCLLLGGGVGGCAPRWCTWPQTVAGSWGGSLPGCEPPALCASFRGARWGCTGAWAAAPHSCCARCSRVQGAWIHRRACRRECR